MASAQEPVQEQAPETTQPETFEAPKAYPIDRYEAGWNKNPFTLKTAPTVLDQDSFAKDLAIGSYFGDAKDPTVVVVNTKTGKRTSLRKSQGEGKDGMQLKALKIGSSRKDAVAEITMGSQTAEVKFDNDYLKQVAGADAARGGQQAPVPGGVPGQQRPGGMQPGQQQNRGPMGPGGVQAANQNPRVQMPQMPQVPQGNPMGSPGGGVPVVQPPVAAVSAANRSIGTVNAGAATVQAASTPSVNTGDVPVVTRRRLITPATPVPGT
ncbi:hypothetical protein [Prosthecobacter vanneervenii]|uniref:Uncharacterized protein n=1 Tax=Prosthecobacter vanneervenii TaxID=48466 RepID=A0A7W8DI88_9BACT|nr:hypothetical protein [Prosthecobacter vanneervenii]MBB5030752.1 hypothetical protein [Prosthecobacter vanneervenii]